MLSVEVAPSRSLVVPGLGAPSRVGWRPALAAALTIVVGQPSLWLIGSLGFALRGGLLLLLASIVVLPTPIELRMLLGQNLGSAGFAPSFMALLVVGAAVLCGLVLAALALIAYLELGAFERLLGDPELADEMLDRHVARPDASARRWLLVSLLCIQLLALAAVVVAAMPLINGIATLAYQEIIRPSLGGTIYVRVLNGVREPLFILLAGLVLVELVASVATRRLLLRGFGLSRLRPAAGVVAALGAVARALGAALLGLLWRPIGTLGTLVVAWLASLAVVVPLSWALGVAWDSVREAYLSPNAASHPQSLAALAVVTLALVAIWVVAVLMGGFASALRAALWSLNGLR